MPSRKPKEKRRIAGQENIVRIEVRGSLGSRGCSRPGLELYRRFPTCQAMDVTLPKCLCPREVTAAPGWRKQVQLPNCNSPHSETLKSSSYIITTIPLIKTSSNWAGTASKDITCYHSPASLASLMILEQTR